MTNIAKIFTVAATLVVGTGAISGIALANTDPLYPDRLKNPKLPPSPSRSGIPAAYRIGDGRRAKRLLPSPGVGSGIPAPYRIGN